LTAFNSGLVPALETKVDVLRDHVLICLVQSSYLHRASAVSKTIFIVPTDVHYYKITEMLKQF